MTKEQFKKAKELKENESYVEDTIEGLMFAKSGGNARLILHFGNSSSRELTEFALEAVLDTLIPMYEKRLEQIKKEFNEL